MQEHTMYLQCDSCSAKFVDIAFSICKEFELMRFSKGSGLNKLRLEVEVEACQSVANFCSKKCRRKGRQEALSTERVLLPKTRPSVGPVEVCAKCSGPVDRSDWHLTYLECDTANLSDDSGKTADGRDLAVVCRNCVPFRFALKDQSDDLLPKSDKGTT